MRKRRRKGQIRKRQNHRNRRGRLVIAYGLADRDISIKNQFDDISPGKLVAWAEIK